MDSGRSIINVWDRPGNRNKPEQQTGLRIQRLISQEHLPDPVSSIIPKFFNILGAHVAIKYMYVCFNHFTDSGKVAAVDDEILKANFKKSNHPYSYRKRYFFTVLMLIDIPVDVCVKF